MQKNERHKFVCLYRNLQSRNISLKFSAFFFSSHNYLRDKERETNSCFPSPVQVIDGQTLWPTVNFTNFESQCSAFQKVIHSNNYDMYTLHPVRVHLIGLKTACCYFIAFGMISSTCPLFRDKLTGIGYTCWYRYPVHVHILFRV